MNPLPLEHMVDALETTSRVRPLTDVEARELDRLLALLHQRRVRLPDQIARARARVDDFVERLSPADQLRELRAEAKRAWDRLRDLEDRLEPGARVTRIERELAA